ncbi:MAG: HDOD domain-containing protein [Rhodocyclaceae bacterium]|nr:HDOD domain-containing protein [Rhodocyclaceae bacterium]
MDAESTNEASDSAAINRYRFLAAKAGSGEILFTSSAALLLQIKRAVEDAECSLDHLAKLIRAEPLLAARVVAVANSVTYNRSGREIADVKQAIARIGLNTVRALAMSLLVRQLAEQPKQPRLAALAHQLWQHTIHVAALAQIIARRVTHQDPEAALFAGILHEVAGFYLLAHAGDVPELSRGLPLAWQSQGEAIVGTALLSALEVPKGISLAITQLWEGYLALPPVSLGDTLLLAEEIAPIPSPLYWQGDARLPSELRCAHIEMLVDQQTLTSILNESTKEVDSLVAALK